jgi:cysteine desulfuration protein SufE
MDLGELQSNLELFDDWGERYQYIIALGQKLPPLADEDRSEANKVDGCISQVWLKSEVERNGSPRLHFTGDSDSAIVKGLVAILRVVYSGKTADDILDIDLERVFRELGLEQHLSPNRRNGFFSMVEQIRREARILSELTA